MAVSQTFRVAIIIHMSLVAANIIVIDEPEPDINEYHCLPNESCIIRCLSSAACARSTFHCPSKHGCDITCDPGFENGSHACFGAVIHAETSQYLSIASTAHLSNAQWMTIYAPYPQPNSHRQSTLTCHSSSTLLHQCSDIQIYTTSGFNDIQLLCNDGTSSCDISGSIRCGYSRYSTDEDGGNYYHEVDECTQLEYKTNQANYQCVNNSFCVDNDAHPQNIQTTHHMFTSNASSVLSYLSTTADVSLISVTSATSLRTFVSEIGWITVDAEDKGDIHALVLVVAGTATVCCVVLIICAGCALIYIRFNKEHVEDVLLRRYLSGKGTVIPYKEPPLRMTVSNENSDEGSQETSNGSTVIVNNEDVDTEDSTDLGLTGLNSDAHSLNNHENIYHNKYPGLIYEDELDNITNDININININNESNININTGAEIKEEDAKKLMLQLNTCDSGNEAASNISLQNSCSNHASINPEISSQDSRTISPRSDCYDDDDEKQDVLCTLPTSGDGDAYRGNDNDSINSAEIEKIPLPPPRQRMFGPDLSDKQMEERAQIHLDNLRNRQRCFGYLQAEILYEVDEDFSSDDTEDEDDDLDTGEEMKGNTTNTTNQALPAITNETDRAELDEDGHKSEEDDGSESDDLLEDGVITTVANEQPIMIKIESPHTSVPNVPHITTSVPNISSSSISSRSSPVPPIRHIPRTSSSTIPRVPSLPPSSCPEMNDPEILSDDGQLPSLPMNGRDPFMH